MSRALGMVTFVALVAGCQRLPGDERTPEQGAATAHALSTMETAAGICDGLAALPPTTCRAPRGDSVNQVETTVVYSRKGPQEHEIIVERMRWVRDENGNVSALHELEFELPDGRQTQRSFETRIVAGVPYRAIDGRFADASRVPDVFEETDRDAHRLVDDLLSLVRIEGGRLQGAGFDNGLCPGSLTPRLGAPDDGTVDWTMSGRSGWLLYRGDVVTTQVTFREVWSSARETVDAPDELWNVDPDRSYIELRRFVAEGMQEGWLSLPPEQSEEGSGQSP